MSMTVENTIASPCIVFDHASVWFGKTPALRQIDLKIFRYERLALIGMGGSGKTTLLRSLNRLHDLNPEFRLEGRILFEGQDIYHSKTDVPQLRRRIGLVGAMPANLPVSIFENVALALKLAGEHQSQHIFERVECGLRQAGVWEEVKDSLEKPALHLPASMQRRLSLARTLAFEPEVLLLDEPGAGLDNFSATALEDTLEALTAHCAVVLATNDIKQAARASDKTAFLQKGELIEWGSTRKLFTQPENPLTHNFITERF